MKVIGISKVVSNTEIENIGMLWAQFEATGVSARVPNKASEDVISLYTDYEGDFTAPFKMIIGHEVTSLGDIPEGLDGTEFSTENHTVYPVEGEFPAAILEKWQSIWADDKPRAYLGDFERYTPSGSASISVGYKPLVSQ